VGSTGNLRLPQTADAGRSRLWAARGRHPKRYLQFLITTGADTLVSVNWVLGRANQMPDHQHRAWRRGRRVLLIHLPPFGRAAGNGGAPFYAQAKKSKIKNKGHPVRKVQTLRRVQTKGR